MSCGSVMTIGSRASKCCVVQLTMTEAVHTRFVDNIVRVGLNYQFH